ncbi:hypothetical protein ZOSMA_277G00010, partial [Zostera marina]
MHKCVVHFIPLNKKLPVRSQHPGFIVQKVYDTVEKKLWKLTDKDYKDHNQSEIELLIQKTQEHLGGFVDVETEVPSTDGVHREEQEDSQKAKWNRRRRNVTIDVSRNDESSTKSDANIKSDTPGSCNSDSSEYHAILSSFQALTHTSHRDNWLRKLLVGMRFVCKAKDSASEKDKIVCTGDGLSKISGTVKESLDNNTSIITNGKIFIWPDDVISAITGLENAVNESLGSDFMKYNQKMRSLDFNLK